MAPPCRPGVKVQTSGTACQKPDHFSFDRDGIHAAVPAKVLRQGDRVFTSSRPLARFRAPQLHRVEEMRSGTVPNLELAAVISCPEENGASKYAPDCVD